MNKCINIVMILMNGILFAGDSVSQAFIFDARYSLSGVTPNAWVAYQAEGLSSRFSTATVSRSVDLNNNGIPDTWETLYGLIGDDAAATADPDGDGLSNLQEYNAGTNPIIAENYAASCAISPAHIVDTWIESAAQGDWTFVEVCSIFGLFTVDTAGRASDTDKDGMPDWYEALYGFNPNVNDANLDSDGDGRTNIQEYNAGTNPVIADDWEKSAAESLNAFLTDTRIIYTGGNPTFDNAFAVIRVSNGFICDTGGLYYDWDGDGIPNWWEARFSRDGSKTGLSASADDDGDGKSNYDEFVAYTDPTNQLSNFTIDLKQITIEPVQVKSSATRSSAMKAFPLDQGSNKAFAIRWQSAKNRTYSVYTTDSLSSKNWVLLQEVEGNGEILEYIPGQNKPAMFFKVSVRLSDNY